MIQSVFARIVLRYAAGALVAYGMAGPDFVDATLADPELVQAVTIGLGALFAALTEWAYAIAKKRGWTT